MKRLRKKDLEDLSSLEASIRGRVYAIKQNCKAAEKTLGEILVLLQQLGQRFLSEPQPAVHPMPSRKKSKRFIQKNKRR